MLVSELDEEHVVYVGPTDLQTYLVEAGVPLSALRAYAEKMQGMEHWPGSDLEAAVMDLVFLLRQAARVDNYRDLSMLTMTVFVGYTIAHPGDTPHIGALSDLVGDWDYRPIGWLAAAAGLTPAEYDAEVPGIATLLTLAALRGHAPAALSHLAEHLR